MDAATEVMTVLTRVQWVTILAIAAAVSCTEETTLRDLWMRRQVLIAHATSRMLKLDLQEQGPAVARLGWSA